MVVALVLQALSLIFITPMDALLPDYESPGWIDALHVVILIPEFNAANALLPISAGLDFMAVLIVVAIAIFPVICVVWIWGAVRP